MRTLSFQKINNKWYVVLPDWSGDFEDLEMVNGADDLLEALSQRLKKNLLTMNVWLAKPDIPCAHLKKIHQDKNGATYQVEHCLFYDNVIWLCNVTRFVFGDHPNSIYFKIA